jgi:hypothetical protein
MDTAYKEGNATHFYPFSSLCVCALPTMTESKSTIKKDGSLPSPATEGADVDMGHYRATVPRWKRVWQHSLTQMILLSIQAFCGPAMADAITGECARLFILCSSS